MREQARRFLMILPYERWSQAGEVVRDYWSCGTARYLQTLRLALRDHIEAKLPHIQTPTLVVRGEHDALAPQPWAEQVTRLLPNARLAVVPGAAHAVNYSAPSQLATLIEGFLEDTRGAPAG
ncbi:MAG: alpha/beta hydrolase [Chloroflexi bacterium]|nr:alpha/beta hydrolase [Chloroflexota bacterium]